MASALGRATLSVVRNALLAAAAGALVLTAAAPAHGNGRFPASNAIYFAPNDPSFIALRTTFGLLISHDGGNNWDWLCDQAVGITNPNSIEDPALGITQNGSMVAALPIEGLSVSAPPNPGCSWSFVPGIGVSDAGALPSVKDVAVRPNDPHTIVALRSAEYTSDAGTAAYTTQVYQSTDDGAHWSTLGVPIDPTVDATTLDVAAADPHRLYISAFHQVLLGDGGSTRTASLFVSTDDGATWTQRPVPLDPTVESAVYIAAVDPTSADKLYLRSEGQSRLMVTTDAGQTFKVSKPLAGNMLGFALSPDGQKVWFGSPEDGLVQLTDPSTLGWTPLPTTPHAQMQDSIRVACLGAHGSDLWACSDEPSGFIVGVSQDGGMTFTPKLHLQTIRGPLACPAGSNDAGCDFGMLCNSLGGCGAPDAGAGDAAAGDGGPTPPTNTKASCGCAVVGGGGAGALVALGAVASAAVAFARRKRGGRRR